ncbi:hypothetical protein CEXT_398981 [Caerostris extrusa]|uniref:Uncharacterized protein n=1 Tax=Caerostris extrusa TaxID=172846 RepID=A0AAV4MMP7_CAEEX|nr:hypothetical protein CEXT_398981 [Caerostris extrusa]
MIPPKTQNLKDQLRHPIIKTKSINCAMKIGLDVHNSHSIHTTSLSHLCTIYVNHISATRENVLKPQKPTPLSCYHHNWTPSTKDVILDKGTLPR